MSNKWVKIIALAGARESPRPRKKGGYSRAGAQRTRRSVYSLKKHSKKVNTGRRFYAGVLTGSLDGSDVATLELEQVSALIRQAVDTNPVGAHCKAVPLCLKELTLPTKMHPGFLAAKAPVISWACECHIRTSSAAQSKGQEDVLTIGELRQVGDRVIAAMKQGSKVTIWGPAEA